jgi:Spy/CpxP family protein refolding chaperone
MRTLICGFISLVVAGTVSAQQPSPYAGFTGRDIKALSPEQVKQLETGEGMGFALAAELNRYPGPRHVLELADSLALTAAQSAAIQAIQSDMSGRARAIGAQIVEQEQALDQAFARGAADSASVRSLTGEIARLTGELRYVHLAAHLAVTRLLDSRQRERYQVLRGYAAHAGDHRH